MSSHFSPAFQAAFERVQLAAQQGDIAMKTAFRDEMLKLGHEERVLNLYRIKDKLTGKLTFFRPNVFQKKFLKEKTHRNIILKSRQIGGTVLQCVRSVDLMLFEENFKGVIIADKKDRVSEIFNDKLKITYERFKKDWGSFYSPTEKFNSKTSVTLVNDGLGRDLSSSVMVTFDARGYTPNLLHFSESSRIEPDRISGSSQGVPATGEITHESTPQGMGGFFFETWQNVRAETSGFKGFFTPWYEIYPETKLTIPRSFKATNEEEILIEEYGLTKQHLQWRRQKISDDFSGDIDKFNEEYPSNDVDCFTAGAGQVFDAHIVKKQHALCTTPKIGYLAKNKFIEDRKAWFAVWTLPNKSHQYAIGADPSGGIGRDKSAAYCKDLQTGEIVARIWSNLLEPADFANDLVDLAKFYNQAFICVEENNHGSACIQKLKELQYGRLYKRSTIDQMTNKPTKKIGFRTGASEKLRVTDQLKQALRALTFKCTDFELIKELTTFVQVQGKGTNIKRQATAGAHDDLVMAAALTEEMAAYIGTPKDEEGSLTRYYSSSNLDPDTGFPL